MEPKLLPARYSLAILFLACAFCCHAQSRVIEVHLEKQKPAVKSTIWAFPLEDDTVPLAELRPRATGLPDEWKAYSVTDDFPQALYQGFCAGKVDEQTCMRKFEAWQRDTTDYSPYPVRIFLMVAFGRDGSGVEHVMFDTDGDYDFSDETDYRLGEQPPLVRMAYERVVNKKIVPDITWVELSDRFGERNLLMWETTQGRFSLEGVEYACTIVPEGSYNRHLCTIKIATRNGSAEYDLKEYARLGDAWYLLDSLAPDGRYLRLECVPDAEGREAMQVGFRPYAFTAVDMAGRTVHFPGDFAGKYVLLDFWALSCGPCVYEIRNYYPDIYARFRDCGFEIVGVADNTAAELRGFMDKYAMPWTVIADRDNGKVRRNPYGITFFPTLLLLGPDGRILEKGWNLRGAELENVLRRYMPDAPRAANE